MNNSGPTVGSLAPFFIYRLPTSHQATELLVQPIFYPFNPLIQTVSASTWQHCGCWCHKHITKAFRTLLEILQSFGNFRRKTLFGAEHWYFWYCNATPKDSNENMGITASGHCWVECEEETSQLSHSNTITQVVHLFIELGSISSQLMAS